MWITQLLLETLKIFYSDCGVMLTVLLQCLMDSQSCISYTCPALFLCVSFPRY